MVKSWGIPKKIPCYTLLVEFLFTLHLHHGWQTSPFFLVPNLIESHWIVMIKTVGSSIPICGIIIPYCWRTINSNLSLFKPDLWKKIHVGGWNPFEIPWNGQSQFRSKKIWRFWRFPEIGVPEIIHLNRIFPYKPSILGYTHDQETLISPPLVHSGRSAAWMTPSPRGRSATSRRSLLSLSHLKRRSGWVGGIEQDSIWIHYQVWKCNHQIYLNVWIQRDSTIKIGNLTNKYCDIQLDLLVLLW